MVILLKILPKISGVASKISSLLLPPIGGHAHAEAKVDLDFGLECDRPVAI